MMKEPLERQIPGLLAEAEETMEELCAAPAVLPTGTEGAAAPQADRQAASSTQPEAAENIRWMATMKNTSHCIGPNPGAANCVNRHCPSSPFTMEICHSRE